MLPTFSKNQTSVATLHSSLATALISTIICLFAACKEQTPIGLDLNNTLLAADSTYISTPPAAQAKAILIEESTANTCANCPSGAHQIEQFSNSNPGRVHSISLRHGALERNDLANNYIFLETQEILDLVSFLGGSPGQPSAAFNRVDNGSTKLILRGVGGGAWAAAFATELVKTTPIHLSINANYDATTLQNVITTTVAFTDTISGNLKLSLYIIENGLVGKQDSAGVEIDNYTTNHYFRKNITPLQGSPILDSINIKELGRYFVNRVIYNHSTTANWNLNNCELVAIVHRSGNTKEVLQVQTCPFK